MGSAALPTPWRAGVRLRPVVADDIAWMADMATDPVKVGAHNWPGEPRQRDDHAAELVRRLAADGLLGDHAGTLVVELAGSTPIGDVQWRTEQWGPSRRSRCRAFGIALLPQHRGRGHGTAAQRLLIDFLFGRDAELHRVQTDTATDNPAEQRVLEKLGMVREGVVRGAEYRAGAFHDHVLFSVLREEWERWPPV